LTGLRRPVAVVRAVEEVAVARLGLVGLTVHGRKPDRPNAELFEVARVEDLLRADEIAAVPVSVVLDRAAHQVVDARLAVREAIDHQHVEDAVAIVERLLFDPEGQIDEPGLPALGVDGAEREAVLSLREAAEIEIDRAVLRRLPGATGEPAVV